MSGFKIYFTDPQTGQVGFSGLMKENGKLALISFRLKLAKGKITEIEQIVARDDGQFFGRKSLTTADPIYAEVLEPAERSPRWAAVSSRSRAARSIGYIPF